VSCHNLEIIDLIQLACVPTLAANFNYLCCIFWRFRLTMANQTPSQGILVVFLKWLLEFSTIYILFCKHQLDRVACLLCGTVLHKKTLDTYWAWLNFEGVGLSSELLYVLCNAATAWLVSLECVPRYGLPSPVFTICFSLSLHPFGSP